MFSGCSENILINVCRHSCYVSTTLTFLVSFGLTGNQYNTVKQTFITANVFRRIQERVTKRYRLIFLEPTNSHSFKRIFPKKSPKNFQYHQKIFPPNITKKTFQCYQIFFQYHQKIPISQKNSNITKNFPMSPIFLPVQSTIQFLAVTWHANMCFF